MCNKVIAHDCGFVVALFANSATGNDRRKIAYLIKLNRPIKAGTESW